MRDRKEIFAHQNVQLGINSAFTFNSLTIEKNMTLSKVYCRYTRRKKGNPTLSQSRMPNRVFLQSKIVTIQFLKKFYNLQAALHNHKLKQTCQLCHGPRSCSSTGSPCRHIHLNGPHVVLSQPNHKLHYY